MSPRHVLLYGSSLLLSGVGAGLDRSADLRVSRVTGWDQASQSLAERVPDVIIFDLPNSDDSRLFQLLVDNPHVLMIALDTECNRAVLVSGRKAESLTVDQITEIIGGPR